MKDYKCHSCDDFTEDWRVKYGCIGVDAEGKNLDGCDRYREKSNDPRAIKENKPKLPEHVVQAFFADQGDSTNIDRIISTINQIINYLKAKEND